jgi:hypothetical protein
MGGLTAVMEPGEYYSAWGGYLVTGIAFSVISWKVMKSMLWRELAYLLQCLLLAIIFTPWYVLPEEEVLAPAIIIFMLDLVTIDASTSIRALIPLVVAMLMGVIVTIILSVIYRIRRRRQLMNVI